jgi:hypothetical protein
LYFYAGHEYDGFWSYLEAFMARKPFGGVRVMRLAVHINVRSLHENFERTAHLNSFHGDEFPNKYLEVFTHLP